MIIRKTLAEIEAMREAGRIVAKTFQLLEKNIAPGVETKELNKIAENFIVKCGARPAFKGFNGFPASICVSINEGVVHGIPGKQRLKKGDLVSIDVGVEYKGYFADAAVTYAVGKISTEARRLIEIAQKALQAGIEQAKVGNHIGDISHAIQKTAESAGFSVVKDFVGHGIGKRMWEEPQIPNYGRLGHGPLLESGMVIAIEPMVNIGGPEVEILPDRWTVVTADRSLSAHFEHTIAILEEGPVILTRI
jgi:methionyl aminopeptidase